MASEGDSRDGAKRRGISLGPQANQILQRLYEPQLGPASALSPGKQQHQAAHGGVKSPLKQEPQALGGGVLKPKHARMKKNASVVTLSSAAESSSSCVGRVSGTGTGAGLASSASVAVLGDSTGVTTMHPTLYNVRVYGCASVELGAELWYVSYCLLISWQLCSRRPRKPVSCTKKRRAMPPRTMISGPYRSPLCPIRTTTIMTKKPSANA